MVEVLRAGLFTTIQDLGRCGHRSSGVPNSGCMDMNASKLANSILNNSESNAVLEITMLGPELKFTKPTQIVITGADMLPKIGDRTIQNHCVIDINAGDILSFGKLKSGLRAYIAVKGGFKSLKTLGSRSLYFPVTNIGNLQKGDTVPYDSVGNIKNNQSNYIESNRLNFDENILNVFSGPEFYLLSDKQKAMLFEKDFHISKYYNRMAYRLSETIDHYLPSILTGPVLPGTVQLTPSGELIILMRDGQTTGGYPRVLQLSETSINLLSQKKERDTIHFELLTL